MTRHQPRSIYSLLLLLLAIPASTTGRTWRVELDGSGDATEVQRGMDLASAGDTVLVGPGTYFENIDFVGKDITVRSKHGPFLTTLDGSLGDDSVVKFHNNETRAARLIGFTITGGRGTKDFGTLSGGGIRCTNASPTIRENHIVDNSVTTETGDGGGITVGDVFAPQPGLSPLIEENLIQGNTVIGNGGGISILRCDPEIRNNMIRDNSCSGDGGGIWAVYYNSNITIRNNQFFDNKAGDHGGAVYVADIGGSGSTEIQGNLFVRNEADGQETGDSGSGGALWLFVVSGRVSNNTLVGNVGRGESLCSGGGIVLDGTPADLEVRLNIIAFNHGCGLACKDNVLTDLGPNLFWQNSEGDLGSGSGHCPDNWSDLQVFEDPRFCGLAIDDYTVATNSPALSGPEPMGASSTPGCGAVSVQVTTWGRLKTMYR